METLEKSLEQLSLPFPQEKPLPQKKYRLRLKRGWREIVKSLAKEAAPKAREGDFPPGLDPDALGYPPFKIPDYI